MTVDRIWDVMELFGPLRGGLAIAVTLPVMLERGYDKQFAAGTVCAVGTLGILIPPSIMLVVMADRMAGRNGSSTAR